MTCNDFRAITISPILCKVFEYCLLDKFSNMLKTSDTQFGFKKGLSYNHAIYSVRRIIEHVVQNGSTVNLCAIDLSKVFDKVNLRALFIKLMQKNIPVQLLWLLEDMICVCFSFVKWGDIRSTFISVMYGVHQGSVLAPFLFTIYLDDLSEICTPNCG